MNSQPERQSEDLGRPQGHDCAFARDLIGSLALGALDTVDRSMVEHHLRWCGSCRDEADWFERVVGFMHLTTPAGPPPDPGSKQALMQRIARIDEATTPSPPPHRPSAPSASALAWSRYASASLIASLALALIVVGAWANSLRTDLSAQDREMRDQAQLTDALWTGGQVQLFSVEQSCPTCEGNGQLGVSESNDMGMVVGYNFDPSQRHDLWGVNDQGDKMMVCELIVDSNGAVMQMFSLPEAPSGFTDVHITDEKGTMIYVAHLSSGTDGTPEDGEETPFPTS